MLLHQTNGIGGRDEFGVIFIEDSLHGGIEEMDRLGQLVGEFEEGIGGGGLVRFYHYETARSVLLQ